MRNLDLSGRDSPLNAHDLLLRLQRAVDSPLSRLGKSLPYQKGLFVAFHPALDGRVAADLLHGRRGQRGLEGALPFTAQDLDLPGYTPTQVSRSSAPWPQKEEASEAEIHPLYHRQTT